MTLALSCRQLTKSLGAKPVLRALDLDVERGEVVTLLGGSGSGKTTLLRMIAGLLEPDSGVIEIGDERVWGGQAAIPSEQRGVAMVFQDYALWPHFTVEHNIDFGLKSQRLPKTETADRVGHALGVTQLTPLARRHPNELSGGQQQRVAIARCLAARPKLMLLDEPLSNLDAALREDLRTDMMQLIRGQGITAIYVTHDQSEAMAVSDRIAVLNAGKLAQFDTPQNIYEHPANAFVAGFIGGFSLLPGQMAQGRFEIGGATPQYVATANAMHGSAMLVVRPEDGRPADVFATNQLAGQVLSSAFQGRCWRLLVGIGGQKIRLDWHENIAVGQALTFSLPPDRCVLVAA